MATIEEISALFDTKVDKIVETLGHRVSTLETSIENLKQEVQSTQSRVAALEQRQKQVEDMAAGSNAKTHAPS